jgi:hypothetical protein
MSKLKYKKCFKCGCTRKLLLKATVIEQDNQIITNGILKSAICINCILEVLKLKKQNKNGACEFDFDKAQEAAQ